MAQISATSSQKIHVDVVVCQTGTRHRKILFLILCVEIYCRGITLKIKFSGSFLFFLLIASKTAYVSIDSSFYTRKFMIFFIYNEYRITLLREFEKSCDVSPLDLQSLTTNIQTKTIVTY